MLWNTDSDTFQLDNQPLIGNVQSVKSTKRCVLKTMLKVYDPVGFISPRIKIYCKKFGKEVWLGMLSYT
ncbi:hypothetical protein X975_21072, partial [Stegodyphus mimosarum]